MHASFDVGALLDRYTVCVPFSQLQVVTTLGHGRNRWQRHDYVATTIPVTLSKTRTPWERDWLTIGEIEVIGSYTLL